jgi:hypothetical protein
MSSKRIPKLILALTLAAFIFSTAGFGQTRKHDVSFQYGFVSNDQVVDIFENIVMIVITLGNFYKDDMKFSGLPFLTYHYAPNSRFGFGGTVGYYSASGSLKRDAGGAAIGDFKERNYIGAVELDYHWVMRPSFQIYSGAGFGVRIRRGTYTDEDETDTISKTMPTFHINALGLRFGGKIGFFVEAGYGYKGVISVGLNGQF